MDGNKHSFYTFEIHNTMYLERASQDFFFTDKESALLARQYGVHII